MFTWQQLHDHISANLKDGTLNRDDDLICRLKREAKIRGEHIC